MEQAPVERNIIRQCMSERSPLPNRIQNAPLLNLGLELYYQAFWDLTTCRPGGYGIAPIPWSAMRDYAVTYGFDQEQQEDLFVYIRVMDNAFLDFKAKEYKRSNG